MENIMKQLAIRMPRPGFIAGPLVALVTVLQATTSFALGTEEQRAACTSDVFKLCSSQIPNVEAIVSCLRTNKKNLSAGCQAVFNTPQEQTATRSLATPESQWCGFTKSASRDQAQQDWLKWCGGAAHEQ
jgi:hypothetical protein